MMTSEELMRRYRETRSEEAFGELVGRYLDWVYGTALRRVNGDTHLAQDVAQTVFCDLALRVQSGASIRMLGGWLHQHTCFVASKMVRAESRRRTHEQQAMNITVNESNWQEIAPHLDEALAQLNPADRHAIILRYFERRDFRSVGSELGLSDDAAQKRVGRAVEKLRDLLARRGVTISAAALTMALASDSVHAAPAGLAGQITVAAVKASSGVSALTLLFLRIMGMGKMALALGGLFALTLVVTPVFINRSQPKPDASPESAVAPTNTQTRHLSLGAATPLTAPGRAETSSTNGGPKLRLTVLDAENDKPLAGVQVMLFNVLTTATDREGHCSVFYPVDTYTLDLRLFMAPFADTHLVWQPGSGDVVPADYTVKLSHAVKLSGRVVGPNNEPVAGARVHFGHNQDSLGMTRPASHEFMFVDTETDAEGRWEITRIARDILYRASGAAEHAQYVSSLSVYLGEDNKAEQELLNGTHVFRLRTAATVRGVVVDEQGQGIGDASVLVGETTTFGSREAKTAGNGEFFVSGCEPKKTLLSAEAPGYAVTTLPIDLSTDSAPFRVVLEKGKPLRLKVVDKSGIAIAGAWVWPSTFSLEPVQSQSAPLIQSRFATQTDREGRAIWETAPDRDLRLDVSARGFMRNNGIAIHPDGQEHVVEMSPELVVSGIVSDESTQRSVPNFRLVWGWSAKGLEDTLVRNWSTIDRFRIDLHNGQFRQSLGEPVCLNVSNCLFKIEADGYEAFVSRVIQYDEGELQFDVRLRASSLKAIKVVSPNGEPASGATVALITPGSSFSIGAGCFVPRGASVLSAAEDGTVRISPDDSLLRIAAASSEGYGEIAASALNSESTIVLKPWGRIEGTYKSTMSRESKTEFMLVISGEESPQVTLDINSFTVETDAAGRFAWLRVPPGRFEIKKLEPKEHASGRGRALQSIGELVDVAPGQTARVNLPGGYTIKARFIVPGGGQPSFANIHTALPEPPPEVKASGDVQAWFAQPEIRAQLQKTRNFLMFRMPDGVWVAEGVPVTPPMSIDSAVFFASPSESGFGKRLFEAKVPVTIPAGPPSWTLDLGEIELKPVE